MWSCSPDRGFAISAATAAAEDPPLGFSTKRVVSFGFEFWGRNVVGCEGEAGGLVVALAV